MKIILFVCQGNIHRSVIATACVQKGLETRGLTGEYRTVSRGLLGSFGTTPPRHENLRGYKEDWVFAEPLLKEFDIVIVEDQRATPITREMVEQAAVIFAMDTLILSEFPHSLMKQFPDLAHKMHLLSEIAGVSEDVADPDGKKTAEPYREVVEMICSTVKSNFDQLLALADQ